MGEVITLRTAGQHHRAPSRYEGLPPGGDCEAIADAILVSFTTSPPVIRQAIHQLHDAALDGPTARDRIEYLYLAKALIDGAIALVRKGR